MSASVDDHIEEEYPDDHEEEFFQFDGLSVIYEPLVYFVI